MTLTKRYYMRYHFFTYEIVIIYLNVNRRKKAGPLVRIRCVFRHFEFSTISIYNIKNRIPFKNLEEVLALSFNGRCVDPS